MAALLLDIEPGDEVIMPSFTFVSTANAFVLRGAKIIFADSEATTPNIDAKVIEELITPRTKAVVIVHYSGFSCDMEEIVRVTRARGVALVEDAAHAIESFYRGRPLGSFGDLATFSFHETKNIIAGEGGLLVVNNSELVPRAEVIWEKGTNRISFARGEVSKYSWIDLGSSFLPSEIIAAYLYAQLESLEQIQSKRVELWHAYHRLFEERTHLSSISQPIIPDYASVNGHIYYLLCESNAERDALIEYLAKCEVCAIFHYLPLHLSPYYRDKHDGRLLPNAVRYSECLLRLPLFYELELEVLEYIVDCVIEFYQGRTRRIANF